MKKSLAVAMGLAVSVALLATGCSQVETADCVGANGQVLPDSNCQTPNGAGGGYGYANGSHWVYGGHLNNSNGYQTITGGSTTPDASGEIDTRSGSTLRGGFGGSDDDRGGRGG